MLTQHQPTQGQLSDFPKQYLGLKFEANQESSKFPCFFQFPFSGFIKRDGRHGAPIHPLGSLASPLSARGPRLCGPPPRCRGPGAPGTRSGSSWQGPGANSRALESHRESAGKASFRATPFGPRKNNFLGACPKSRLFVEIPTFVCVCAL